MAATYEPIESVTLTSDVAGVTFDAIAPDWTDLVLVITGESTRTDSSRGGGIRVGSGSLDEGSNYSVTTLQGNGSAATSYRTPNYDRLLGLEFGRYGYGDVVNIAHFMSYASTNNYKTVLMSSANANNLVLRTVGLWRSSSAITHIQVLVGLNELAAGTTLSLFGIKAAP